MKQHKVIAENNKQEFEIKLNKYAGEGWEIIHYGNSVSIGKTSNNTIVCFSAILEKEKTDIKRKLKFDKKKRISTNTDKDTSTRFE